MADGIVSARLTNIVLPTADLNATTEFYRRLFGFEPFHQDATCVFLRTTGSHLVFVLGNAKNESVGLDLSVPSLAEAAAALAKSGIEYRREGEHLLVLRDLDGNLIELVQG